MNTQKLHRCLKDAMTQLGCREEPLPERVLTCFRTCLQEVHGEDFPDYLREDYKRLKMHLNLASRPGRSSDGSAPRVNMSVEEARDAVEQLVRLFCEVETHRAPHDPNSMFLNQKAELEKTETSAWTQPWMEAKSQ